MIMGIPNWSHWSFVYMSHVNKSRSSGSYAKIANKKALDSLWLVENWISSFYRWHLDVFGPLHSGTFRSKSDHSNATTASPSFFSVVPDFISLLWFLPVFLFCVPFSFCSFGCALDLFLTWFYLDVFLCQLSSLKLTIFPANIYTHFCLNHFCLNKKSPSFCIAYMFKSTYALKLWKKRKKSLANLR